MSVKIVTDSAASIPPELCRQLGITVVPVPIQFGDKTHLDGVDPPEQFYDYLTETTIPSTAAPSPAVFDRIYRRLLDKGTRILSLHMMGNRSSLLKAATVAAGMQPEGAVKVMDTGSISIGEGLLVMAAAKAAQAGQSLSQIVSLVERLRDQVYVFASAPQLNQLRRSGRVSLGQALMGSLLSIKPVIFVGQSTVDVVDKVRGWQGALVRMVDLLEQRVKGAKVWLAVGHTNVPKEAQQYLDSFRSRFDCVSTFVVDAGTAVATHMGPGAFGVAALVVEPGLFEGTPR